MKKAKIRLDVKIVQDGLAANELEARALIMAGKVVVGEQRVDKAGTLVRESDAVRIKDQRRFVSRGGEKLWGAVEELGMADLFKDAVVLDCGASTGGFTDCALQLGARKVYALEVGFNQLAWSLRTDPRVVSKEGCDIRTVKELIDESISIVMADISFNSLDRLLPAILRVVPRQAVNFLLLVKPQFELNAEAVPQHGVIDDPLLQGEALTIAKAALQREGLRIRGESLSRVKGRDGNQEIFVWASLDKHEGV